MTVVEINNTDTFDLLFKDGNPKESRIFVDVGGYNGDTVTKALNINPNLRIVVIEPIKMLADTIQQKFQSNKNVTVINKAAWNNKCNIPFNEYVGWANGLSTLQPIMTQLRPAPQFTNQILKYNVEADTLNNILSNLNINTVDYLKIDTEGSEEQVLSGFTKYHNNTRFHVEHHITNLSNILQKLQEIGSDIEKITVSRDTNIKEHVVGTVIGKFKPITSLFSNFSKYEKIIVPHACNSRIQYLMDRAIKNKEKILNVGCTDNFMFRDTNLDVMNVDITNEIPEAYKSKTKFQIANAHNLPFNNNEFNCTILGEVLEHVKDPIQVLKEAKRVSKNVYITVPNEYNWHKDLNPFQNPAHVRHYTYESLKEDLDKAYGKDNAKIIQYDGGGWSFFCAEYENNLDLSNCVYNEGYFTGESNIGYRYPGYKNFDNNYNVIKYILNQNPTPKSVIEIGGARGYITRMLEEKNIKSTCVDVSKYCWDTRATNSFVLHDITNIPLPFTDKQWDLLFTKDLMEHLPESKIDDIIKDMERISERAIHAITFSTHPTATEDITHTLLRTKDWWINKFKEIVPDYNVDIIDKELFNDNINISKIENTKQELIITNSPTIPESLGTQKNPNPNPNPKIEVTITKGPISRNTLRIALISTPFFTLPPKGYSGLEQIVWDLAESLDELGHEVTIFGPEGSQSPKHGHLITTGLSVSTVNVNWFEEERKNYEIYKQYITPGKFDIVHGHTWMGFEYLLKTSNPTLNIVHTHHGGYSWVTPPPFPKPNLVAISNHMKNYTIQYFNQKGYKTDCKFVHNGIDLDKYPYQFNKTEHLLFVGRLSTFKQPHLAVELARKTDHKLDIVGGTFVDSDQYVMQLDKMIENDQNIQIFKDVIHQFKIEKMQNAKALIFPSKMNEPFGLVALEAMACGTPVIALRDGAIDEVVIHNETGFICDNMSDMIDALKNIHTIDPKNCRKRAEQLSRQHMAENYEILYKDIINNREW